MFFLELFFVAKVAIINRNHRFAFFLGTKFRQSEEKKKKIEYYVTTFPSAQKQIRQISKKKLFYKNSDTFEFWTLILVW